MRVLGLVLTALLVAACAGAAAPSPVPWGEFQSRVLDANDRYQASGDLTDASVATFMADQKKWADSITADPCYDPALRAFRAWLGDVVTAYSTINGRPLSSVSDADLATARAALESAISNDDRLTASLTLATGACNR